MLDGKTCGKKMGKGKYAAELVPYKGETMWEKENMLEAEKENMLVLLVFSPFPFMFS